MKARILGPVFTAASAAAFTSCLVCLYEGMRHVMVTSGGFVPAVGHT